MKTLLTQAIDLYLRHREKCRELKEIAIKIMNDNGFYDIEDFDCSYIPGEDLCFTIHLGDSIPDTIPCSVFFYYFEYNHIIGDDIVENLKKLARYEPLQ
jgi:hypothetical protein